MRCGSRWSPTATVLVAQEAAALVVEPASRSAGDQHLTCMRKSPRLEAGGFFVPQCCAISSRNSAQGRIQPLPVPALGVTGGRKWELLDSHSLPVR